MAARACRSSDRKSRQAVSRAQATRSTQDWLPRAAPDAWLPPARIWLHAANPLRRSGFDAFYWSNYKKVGWVCDFGNRPVFYVTIVEVNDGGPAERLLGQRTEFTKIRDGQEDRRCVRRIRRAYADAGMVVARIVSRSHICLGDWAYSLHGSLDLHACGR